MKTAMVYFGEEEVTLPEFVDVEQEEHDVVVDPVGVISEVINNIHDLREGIRELLSNSAAKEVRAENVEVSVYESELGLSFTVEDDGCGMDYTGDPKNPGRLDKFLNVAQGRQAGFGSDEFGTKGFGTILLYNSRQVVVETCAGGEHGHRVILEEPRRTIKEDKKLTQPKLERFPVSPEDRTYTKVTVKGWNSIIGIPDEFRSKDLERYLQYQTVVGYTLSELHRGLPLPSFTLRVAGDTKPLTAGYPYLFEEEDGGETITFDPITKRATLPNGSPVNVTLKGGCSTESKKFGLNERTGGIWLSVNGIPYFRLDRRRNDRLLRILNLKSDFIRFVAECNEVVMDLSRGDLSMDEANDPFFQALMETLEEVRESNKFKEFYRRTHKKRMEELATYMAEKKEEFASEERSYVYLVKNGKKRYLVAEPESEYDTLTVLWKLEILDALPFERFRTLQYAGYFKGMDLLVDFQEESTSQLHKVHFAEVEHDFAGFIRHKHDPAQVNLVICWKASSKIRDPGKREKTGKPYKFIYRLGEYSVDVFVLSRLPNVKILTRREIEMQDSF
jgi:hypothetical protein